MLAAEWTGWFSDARECDVANICFNGEENKQT
jgi:hypothetical protein